MPESVPELLQGVWRRVSIVNDDGSRDTTSTVVWLQLDSAMVDVRIPIGVTDPLQCEASTGFTTCTDVVTGADGIRRATAEWHTRGPADIAIHPVSAYPEPGLLEWSADGSVLIERAPSGAYVEEWQRVPSTETPMFRATSSDGNLVYVAGDIAVVVCDDRGDDLSPLDLEFAICERTTDGLGWRIVGSTLPGRAGVVIDVDL